MRPTDLRPWATAGSRPWPWSCAPAWACPWLSRTPARCRLTLSCPLWPRRLQGPSGVCRGGQGVRPGASSSGDVPRPAAPPVTVSRDYD